MKLAAPAKINLALHVTGQRSDGYHLIESLVVFADAADQISFDSAPADRLTFSGPFGGMLSADTGENLVLKARDALRSATALPCPPVAIHLEKNLPLSSGIGGGSADAAATLTGLNDHWRIGFTLDQLCKLGLTLGADVPMCLLGRPLIAKGIGEIIEPVDLPQLHLLLVNPGVLVSTPAIFKALMKKENGGLPCLAKKMSTDAPASVDLEEFTEYLHSTRNDLQDPAITVQPVISDAISALEAGGASFARMSGSGATCFGIFSDPVSVGNARAAIVAAHPDWWVR